MSVTLVRVKAPEGDGDEEVFESLNCIVEVSLPSILGRGSLLKCGDKRVSRRHAFLDWEDTGVQLTSVHQNPTFVITTSASCNNGRVLEVTEGSSTLLYHGDKFGLLKNKFWYMIKFPSTLLKEEKKEEQELQSEYDNEKEEVVETKVEEEGNNEEDDTNGQEREASRKRRWRGRATMERSGEVDKETHNKEEEGRKKNPDVTTIKETAQNREEEKGSRKEDEEEKSVNTDQATFKKTLSNKEKTEAGKVEDNILQKAKNDKLPIHEKNVEMEAGDKENSSSNLPTSSSPLCLPKREKVKEILVAMTTKKRQLPQWIIDVTTSSVTTAPTPTTTTIPSHHCSKKPRNPHRAHCSHTSSATTLPTIPKEDDEDLFCLNSLSKRKRMGASTPFTQVERLQQETKKSPQSSVKEEGQGMLHQISDESGEEEDQNGLFITTATITSTPPPHPHPHPHPPPLISHHSSTNHQAGSHVTASQEEKDVRTSNCLRTASLVSPTSHSTSPTTAACRPSCQYGARCYRKNPLHKQSEAHPGDDDYLSTGANDSDDDDDGRGDDIQPECEYGINCYRQNPQHRQAFKHSRVPQPQRTAKRKAKQQKGRQTRRERSNSDSEEDDYDLNDPFLTDGSSDDYTPTDDSSDSATEPSQEVQEEDAKRMLKEAKRFVKKR